MLQSRSPLATVHIFERPSRGSHAILQSCVEVDRITCVSCGWVGGAVM